MSDVQILAPAPGPVGLEELRERLAALTPTEAFSDRAVAFASSLSRAVGAAGAARKLPAFQSLAFWLRPAEVKRLMERGRMLARNDELLVPRGTAFHLPPSNVDTMFIYSWMLSLFAGNANVIRVSSRILEVHDWLWETLRTVLMAPEHAEIAARTLILSYGHDNAVTSECSAACDIRVVWGGDATVAAIRAVPLSPRAVDVVFPDRHSFAILGTEAYWALEEPDRDRVAERFYNDAFWFDQLGCASPRLVAFVGQQHAAAADFWQRLARVSQHKGYMPEGTDVVAKFVAACDAVVRFDVSEVRRYSPAVTVVELDDPQKLPRDGPGGGYFYSLRVRDLDSLSAAIRRRDQTVTSFGIDIDDLRAWAVGLNGRGVDRIVPMGEALAFDSVWDGIDLLQALTRRVTLKTSGLGAMA